MPNDSEFAEAYKRHREKANARVKKHRKKVAATGRKMIQVWVTPTQEVAIMNYLQNEAIREEQAAKAQAAAQAAAAKKETP